MPKFNQVEISNIDRQIEQLMECKPLSEAEVKAICEKVKEILTEEANVQPIRAPVTICGDIHGQFYDLLELFRIGGRIPETNYLFMGDYVDRGFHSVETVTLLVALKVRYRNRITILRGNHECRQVTQVYGFYDECNKKYGNANVWKCFTDLFDYLPLIAVVENQIFCLHGESKKYLMKDQYVIYYGQILMINADGIFHQEEQDIHLVKIYLINSFIIIIQSLQQEHINQSWMDIVKLMINIQQPNYCYRCGNQAAIMEVDEHLNQTCIQFDPAQKKTDINANKRTPDQFLQKRILSRETQRRT